MGMELIEVGDIVENPDAPEWGVGQVQSMIDGRVTVNFENLGKVVLVEGHVQLVAHIPGRSSPQGD